MKRPSFQFYPSDWRKDPALSACSIGARGLWIELLCIAHESDLYGHLSINDKPMNTAQIARMVGETPAIVARLMQGRISTAYTFDELIYEPRNPQADVLSAGYGLAESELMIRVVTGFLNAMSYNIKGFDSNAIPKGMLHLTGNYDDRDIAAFKRYWNSMVRGVQNAWSLPVMVSKDQESKASFENFGVEFNEMYFSKWMTFLTSIICAIYGMSPAEINFDSFSRPARLAPMVPTKTMMETILMVVGLALSVAVMTAALGVLGMVLALAPRGVLLPMARMMASRWRKPIRIARKMVDSERGL